MRRVRGTVRGSIHTPCTVSFLGHNKSTDHHGLFDGAHMVPPSRGHVQHIAWTQTSHEIKFMHVRCKLGPMLGVADLRLVDLVWVCHIEILSAVQHEDYVAFCVELHGSVFLSHSVHLSLFVQ